MKKIKFLTEEQLKTLFNSIQENSDEFSVRDFAILKTLFSTGLRIAELLNLERKVFADLPTLRNTFELSIIGKGKRARTVYFSPEALGAIKRWLQVSLENSSEFSVGEKLFPLSARAVQYIVKRRCEAAGLGELNLTPHSIRHTFATHLLKKGVNLFVVQNFLGHRSIATTQIYLHVVNSELKKIHQEIFAK